ncbi:MAG: cytochrome c biogenesis protein ResB [Desulfocapsa sp.]|nr:MAG: cytochrome c biogenesis protein ResB [Desulfocapsa sp.]
MNKKNPVVSLFASVKLALFTLCLLAVTSIIGTIIPQKESFDFYVHNFSESTARIFQVLSIPDMYNSWWFLGLLGLLSVNLIVCSFDRFPGVWRQIQRDNLATDTNRLSKMRLSEQWSSEKSEQELAAEIKGKLSSSGWRTEQRKRDNALLLFAQKGAMTRTGVYIVHASILFIFIGAIVGELTGFKGSIMLPETQSTTSVYEFGTSKSIDLGFEVRCNRFDIEFYDTGMPKAYRSSLTVLENNKIIMEKDIVVNDPLTYKGITFYQSSYQGYQDFILNITDKKSGVSERISLPFQQRGSLTKYKDTVIGVINAETMGQSVSRLKVWFKDAQGPASVFWIPSGEEVTVQRADTEFIIGGKQMYATGLQVAKDPGVWIVYIGCGMMIFGLFVAFFMSHKRIWILLKPEEDAYSVTFAGSSNKNKVGFEKTFDSLATTLKK